MSESAAKSCPVCGEVAAPNAASCRGCGESFTLSRTKLLSWPRAFAFAVTTVYGPFVAMATFMLLFVPCSHCKRTAWVILPWAPAILPVGLASRLLAGGGPLPEIVAVPLELFLSGAVVLICAGILRNCGWGRIVVGGLQFLISSYLAIVVMGLIRA